MAARWLTPAGLWRIGVNVFGGRPTLAGTALAELCASTIYADGTAALDAVRHARVDEALERVVEANTLLSGLGYESGGLSVAHGLAQGYTVIEHVHRNHLHGEMVAMGVLAQLMLEPWGQEAQRAAGFFASVGLPVRLSGLGLAPEDQADLGRVVEAAMAFPFIGNMPVDVTPDKLLQAVLAADRLGEQVLKTTRTSPGEQCK